MPVSLYPHNAEAYRSALVMLAKTGKAAIVHPTGTGKSFIGFKLCEDNPDKTICWLSPSEYIFRTQLENLSNSADGFEPHNIHFITYARLMQMNRAEIREIRPDFIVLDEFHRCGAEQWGKGVGRLLDEWPQIPLLGLTATSVRYLDGQRDMAEELFEGNVCSRMDLGEAIVRGILNPPRYILSVYSYQKDLERYRRKIQSAKNKATRDAAEECYEALRRELEKAEGLDSVFGRHMTKKDGKYLVFCSNTEHMEEMIRMAPTWFSMIDPEPHIYRVFAEDPDADRSFAGFKSDNSGHLKLLYCIDMLNEGVHVDGVSGVIMLRPTESPTVYKQQIGRAMAAGAEGDAVIFDIVLNIDGLCSISSIKEEMQAAVTYYKYLGRYGQIVNETFRVTDETKDCRRLFDDLERRLNASWDLMYAEAKRYYLTYGDLMVPARYKTENGLSLGSWLNLQRKIYSKKAEGLLTDGQVEQLNAIGIVWDSYNNLTWEKNYLEAKNYYERFGNLTVPAKYMTETGFPLGAWIMRMRAAQSDGRSGIMTAERRARLDEIGMNWDVFNNQWESNYLEAVDYYKEHGDLLVPGRYISPSGIRLGHWIAHLRMAKNGRGGMKLTEEQTEKLDSIGMVWNARAEHWQEMYDEARAYYEANGNLKVPRQTMASCGQSLGLWVSRMRHNRDRLSVSQVRALNRIGMQWGKSGVTGDNDMSLHRS